MDKPEKKITTRQRLLKAAGHVIVTQGIQALTLEAVAQEANLSKGGLLYHFPSKDQLIQELIQNLVEDFYERLNAELSTAAEAVGTPGRWLRAYIHATFNPAPHEQEISAALSIAVATKPEMLDVLKDCFGTLQREAEQDGLDPALAALIRLATDGFWYANILQLAPLDESLRSELRQRLLQLTEGKSQ